MQISPIAGTTQNAYAVNLFNKLSPTAATNCQPAGACTRPHSANRISSPLINAAFEAFEAYIGTQECQHNALIAGVAMYALSPKGAAQGISQSQIAPFLALNILA